MLSVLFKSTIVSVIGSYVMKKMIYFIRQMCLVYGLMWSFFSVAAPVTWTLEFHNLEGVSAGEGTFSYDLNTDSCLDRFNPATCIDGVPNSAIDFITIEINGFDSGTKGFWFVKSFVTASWWTNFPQTPAFGPGNSLSDEAGGWALSENSSGAQKNLILREFARESDCVWNGIWKTSEGADLLEGTFIATSLNCSIPPVSCSSVPRFSFKSGVLDMPTVMVTDTNTPYKVKMQLNPVPIAPMTFSVTSAEAQ